MQKRILVRREAASIAAIDAACCGGWLPGTGTGCGACLSQPCTAAHIRRDGSLRTRETQRHPVEE